MTHTKFHLYIFVNYVSIRSQKDSFCNAKGLVLGSKRTRFEQQKESFCKAKGLHSDYLKRHSKILYRNFRLIIKRLV